MLQTSEGKPLFQKKPLGRRRHLANRPLWSVRLVPLRLERSESAASLEYSLPQRPFDSKANQTIILKFILLLFYFKVLIDNTVPASSIIDNKVHLLLLLNFCEFHIVPNAHYQIQRFAYRNNSSINDERYIPPFYP